MINVIGIDIGGTHFRIGLFDQEGHRLSLFESHTDRAGGRDWMLGQIRERAQPLMDQAGAPITACGVSFGGPVNFDRQVVSSLHSPGWVDFPLAEWAQQNLKLPCRVDNDANAGAIGEYRFGAGRGTQSLFYITISTGIGGGLVCDGKVFRGKDNLAGEIGHIPISDSGMVCSCGARGCLESFSSASVLTQRCKDWASRQPERVARIIALSGGNPEEITAKAVVEAAAEGDLAAAQIWQEATRYLARGVQTVIRLLNPELVVLGGGVSQAGPMLLNPVREYLKELSSPTISYSTQVLLATLGNHSPLYGAAALALEIV